MFGTPESGVEPNLGVESNPNAGTIHTGISQSWTTIWCSGKRIFTDHSSDDFSKINVVPLNDRQRKIVFIYIDRGTLGTDLCTGTMVDSNSVLTAAHCVTEDDDGNQFPANDLTVCSMENLDENITGSYVPACFTVDDIDTPVAWDGDDNSGPEDDYAVLNLDGSPGVGWFALSTASDSYINNYIDFHRGYPANERDCDLNSVEGTPVTDTSLHAFGRHMYGADGDIQGTPSGWVKYDTSSAASTSGGPHYYCPNGSGCEDGHYMTGVHSGAEVNCSNEPCSSGYTYGAKARDIRDWVINHM